VRLRGRYQVRAERYLRAGASILSTCAADGKGVSGARSPRISFVPTRAKVSRFDWRQGLFANAVAICAHDIRTALPKRRQRTWLAPMQHQRHDLSSYDLRTSVSQLSRSATTRDGVSMHSRVSLPMSLRKQTVRSEQSPASSMQAGRVIAF
jgi:hypothetical protein